MIVCVDVGNTSINIGAYENDVLEDSYSIYCDKKKSSDEYRLIFNDLLKEHDFNKIEGSIISSVVPELTLCIFETLKKLFKKEPLLVSQKLKTKIPLKIDNPNELGSDLLCDSVGAVNKFGYPILIIDLGTASKILVIDNKGNYCGGVLMPGIGISYISLTSAASMLGKTDVSLPKTVSCRNTKDCINSGILYGHVEAIKGLIKRIEDEFGYSFKKVLTGGYAKLVNSQLDDIPYDVNLTLDGLYKIYLINEGK